MARRCSFCGEARTPARPLLAASDSVAICPDCARLAIDVAVDEVPTTDLLVTGIGRALTNDARRGDPVGWVSDAAMVVRAGWISWIGQEGDLPEPYLDYPELPCEGRMVVPGMVDAGSRILGSSHHDRQDADLLLAAATDLADRSLRCGVTTIDIRAGGTDDPTLDTYLLAIAREVGERFAGTAVITWQCSARAHSAWVSEMVPAVSRLATFVHLACSGAGTLAGQIEAVNPMPIRVTCLADRRDHICLDDPTGVVSTDAGVRPPAPVTVIGPRTLLTGGHLYGDAFALASDCDLHGVIDPGLGLPILLAVELGGFGAEQALWAATRGGALALGQRNRGILKNGAAGDFVIYDASSAEEVVSDPGGCRIHRVVVGGMEIPGNH